MPVPPIWDLLDHQPSAKTLQLLSLVEFTDLLNGCSHVSLVWNAFVLLRMVTTARYLYLKSQELHEAEVALLTDQLPAMSTKYQEAPAAASDAEPARLDEWETGLLRGQIGLAQQDLTRVRNVLTTALAQAIG